jgi:hypothetical protein
MDFDDLDPRLRKPGAGSKIIEFEDDFEDSEPVQPQPRMKAKPVNVNPLRKYFRVPGISVTLPSGGYWYKNDEVNFNITNEVDVFPIGKLAVIYILFGELFLFGGLAYCRVIGIVRVKRYLDFTAICSIVELHGNKPIKLTLNRLPTCPLFIVYACVESFGDIRT